MNYREMNLRVFRGEPVPHVLFQPRFEPWIAWNRQFDSLPPACQGKSVLEIYDQVDCSMRYIQYYTGQPDPVVQSFADDVKIDTEQTGEKRVITYHTPHGDLVETREFTVDKVWRTTDHCGKSTDDLPALQWLLERRRFRFDIERFRQGEAFLGERGAPQFWVPKSPYLALCQQWMNFEAFMYALFDAPETMRDLMAAIDASYDTLYEQITSAEGPVIINYGENIAEAHLSPTYFDEYLLPWYEKRVGQLHEAGLFAHVHIDGHFKTLIENIRNLPHDGLEALTPLPQGDVTLAQMERALNGKVLLDGIPAVLFLDHHRRDDLEACVEDLIQRFAPKLILGISDELPEAATAVGYDRLCWVAERCREAKA